MALTTLYLRHQLRRALSHLTTTTTKHLIPYSSPQRLTNTNTATTAATYRNFHLTHFPRSFSPKSRSFNDIDKIDPDTILYEECDYKHWLIVMDFGRDKREFPPPDQMIDTYVQTAANVVGSVEEAKRKIYACSTTTYTGFQVEVDEETSKKFEGLPGVIFVLPDYSYMDPINNEYDGDKYINGEIIHRPPPVSYGRTRRPDGSNETRERFPMSNQQRNRGFNQQGNPPYNQLRNPPYNHQVNPPYNQQQDPAYYQQQESPSPYDHQENPAYNQQESTRGYGRSYTPQGFYQQQHLPPQQNYPPNQNMGSLNPALTSNSIPNSMPPYNQQANSPYNQPGNPPYNCQGNLAYNQQHDSPYNQQESTRGYGRSYTPQSPQQWQPLPPQQNYPPNQNMGSFNPTPISNSIPYSMPPYNQQANPLYNQPGNPPYYRQGNPVYNQQQNSPYNQQRNPAYNQQEDSPYNQQHDSPYNQQGNPTYNQQDDSPYNLQGNPTYNQQHDSPYNQQGSPTYNEQESTRGYGRSYTPQSPQQQQPLPPQQNYPPNQNMGSFNPLPTSNSIPNSVPPYNHYNRQGNPAYNPQQDSPYNQQGNPAYNQQESTRGYGRSYTPRSRQRQQPLPPKQNHPPNQNMRSFKPVPTIDSILKSLPPSKRGKYYFGYN